MARLNGRLLVAAFSAAVGAGVGMEAALANLSKGSVVSLAVLSAVNLGWAAFHGIRGWRANTPASPQP
jgi:hypothetical protein